MAGERETLARLADGDLRELLRMIAGSDIEELELEVAGTRLYFRRPTSGAPSQAIAVDGESLPVAGGPEAAFVVAEQVGFFHYPGQDGGAPLQVGDRVTVGQMLGVVDSLSVPNPVQAARSGRIEEVLVEEGQPVEFGQPLFVIRPGED